MESDNVGVTVIGTHFLDLSQISNDGDKGEDLECFHLCPKKHTKGLFVKL